MIRSMTGYGRAQQTLHGRDITVEIQSVNHRFFEFSARVPRAFGYLQEKLKHVLNEQVARGKVEVFISILSLESGDSTVTVDHSLAHSYLQSIRALGQDLMLEDTVTLSQLLRFHDIFQLQQTEVDEDALWQDVHTVLTDALQAFVQMREREGASLQTDLLLRLARVEECVTQVELRAPETVEAYRNRLFKRLSELLEDRQIDEARILTEAALFAEKTDTAEETVRLRSHIDQFRSILQQEDPVGRKLDFLVQEINREANTIGSKAQNLEISRQVVEIKSELEKIREQIQNIE